MLIIIGEKQLSKLLLPYPTTINDNYVFKSFSHLSHSGGHPSHTGNLLQLVFARRFASYFKN